MKNNGLIELVERERFFRIGNPSERVWASVNKPSGILLIKKPIWGAILSVKRFEIDEEKTPPQLYVNYEGTSGDKRRYVFGAVRDVQQAKEWIEKVNHLYEPSA